MIQRHMTYYLTFHCGHACHTGLQTSRHIPAFFNILWVYFSEFMRLYKLEYNHF